MNDSVSCFLCFFHQGPFSPHHAPRCPQLFETCSVADALPATLGMESEWYSLLKKHGYTPEDVWAGADALLKAM